MISDKEVGRLWKESQPNNFQLFWRSAVLDLIQKLVEERAKNYSYRRDEDCRKRALRDFGIPEYEYENDKR